MRIQQTIAYVLLVIGPAAATTMCGAQEYRGGLVSPPQPKPSFTLKDTSAARFDFREKTQGYVTLLFFGYTHCADMCPMQMSTIAQALKALPPGEADQFKVVFVTTDPQRDSSAVLRSWLDHFDRHFIGLTGSEAEIVSAQAAASVSVAKKSEALKNGGYGIDHSAWTLAYTRDNLAHVIYPVGVKKEDWIHDLRLLVKATW